MNSIVQPIQLKNGMLELPKSIKKKWTNSLVSVFSSDDTVIIKKVQTSDFWDTWKSLKKIKNKISNQDIEKAIKWARKK